MEFDALRAGARESVDDLLRYEPEFVRTAKVLEIVDRTMFELGYANVAISEEFGGSGLDLLTRTAITIEFSRMSGKAGPAHWLKHGEPNVTQVK